MNRFVKRIQNERGVSLVEMLGALTIFSVATLLIYSVFAIGLKTYTKITAEGQLRDEADYVVAMIMNELYSSDYDDVQYNEATKSLEFYKRKDLAFQNDALTYSYYKASDPAARLYIENGQVLFEKTDGDEKKISSFQDDTSAKLTENSSIGVICTQEGSITYEESDAIQSLDVCSSGVVQLQLIFQTTKNIQPFAMTSEIGF